MPLNRVSSNPRLSGFPSSSSLCFSDLLLQRLGFDAVQFSLSFHPFLDDLHFSGCLLDQPCRPFSCSRLAFRDSSRFFLTFLGLFNFFLLSFCKKKASKKCTVKTGHILLKEADQMVICSKPDQFFPYC